MKIAFSATGCRRLAGEGPNFSGRDLDITQGILSMCGQVNCRPDSKQILRNDRPCWRITRSWTASESFILAHGCAGIDIAAPPYVEGVPGCSRRGFQRLRLN